MTDKKKTQDTSSLTPDLSVLAEFQFGPSWAREEVKKDYSSRDMPRRPERPARGEGRDGRFARREGAPRRDMGDRRDNRERRDNRDRGESGQRQERRPGRFDRSPRERAPLPEPAPGLRVELRPVDLGLAACVTEVSKHKRVVSLFDFAKIIMGKRDRYDLVFMKQEGGPDMYCSGKGDHACWLTRGEAVKYIWKAPWFGEYYDVLDEAAEPPKGEFSAIGKCVFGDELIGPVNWHGYQSALLNLHRTKYAHMDIDRFKSKIKIEKGEEFVRTWLDSVSKKTVWKSKREGAEELVFDNAAAVEKDFEEHHFDEAYTVVDKIFINGSVARQVVSPGIWAHIVTLSDVTRKHPSMLIPNICHGLARHHMPIFKWKGGHHTGPSRPRALSPETVLADRMMAIVDWAQRNQGKRVDVMLKDLCKADSPAASPAGQKEEALVQPEPPVDELQPVAQEVVEEPAKAEEAEVAAEPALTSGELKRQELVRDLFWLCDQGYILVFADGRVCLPKAGETDPAGDSAAQNGGKKKKARKKPGKKVQEPLARTKEEPVTEEPSPVEQPAEEPVVEEQETSPAE